MLPFQGPSSISIMDNQSLTFLEAVLQPFTFAAEETEAQRRRVTGLECEGST